MLIWLERHHRTVLAIAVLAAAAAAVVLARTGLRNDYSLKSFVGGDHPAYHEFQAFMNEFSGSEVAVIAVRSGDALSHDPINALADLARRAEALPAVARTSSLARVPRAARGMWLEHELVDGLLISRDRRTAALILHLRPESEIGDQRRQTVTALRDAVAASAAQHPEFDVILTGPYVTMYEMFELVHRDQLVFGSAMAVLMLAVLRPILGSWRRAGVTIGVALTATLLTMGAAVLLQLNLALQSPLVVIMITTLSVATLVHLTAAIDESAAPTAAQRAGEALRRLAMPCSGVLVTSALGFAVVAWSRLQPIRVFGLLMAGGLLVTGVIAFAATGLLAGAAPVTPAPRRISGLLARLAEWPIAAPRRILAVFTLATLAALWPIPSLQLDSEFVNNFHPDSPVRSGYAFVERNLAPLSSIEVLITPAPDAELLSLDAITRCAALTEWAVATFDEIPKALSVADLVRDPSGRLPATPIELQTRLAAVRWLTTTLLGTDGLALFTGVHGNTLRLSFLARESADVRRKIAIADTLAARAATAFAPPARVRLTGLYVFYAQLILGLLRDQWFSFAMAVGSIMMSIALWLRSWRLAAVALLPNLLPAVACLGLMGWLDIPVNMASAMMLSIALGIAVDDTLHYLWRYRAEIRDGADRPTALRRTHGSVGRACLFTTVVLALGFWVLCFSQFVPMAYFGALVGTTMLVALAADLLLLPAMLCLWPAAVGLPR